MDKLKLRTPDFTEANIAKIAELFPNCVTEAKDGQGNIKKAIDFDQLRQEISDHVVDGPRERYHLSWPGKNEALLAANTPIAKTLRPCREESLDFDTTKNLFLEGDNLDALKLLQETYLNKVKMIYIDPPYNKGKDFIYSDSFTADKAEYELSSGVRDEDGNKLVSEGEFKQNTTANGRFHSDWLSMIYPRLKLARNLLQSDGVVFVSIDDSEQENLKKVCDEIFGAENFVAEFVWKSKLGKVGTTGTISSTHEYIICYARRADCVAFAMIEKPHEGRRENLRQWGQADRREDRPSMYFPITIDGITVYPVKDDGTEGRWRVGKQNADELLSQGLLEAVEKDGRYNVYRNFPAGISAIPYDTLLLDEIGTTAKGSLTLKELGMQQYFSYPKSVELLRFFCMLASSSGDVVLDFFAGSATTAHAVMQLNTEDGGNRKFIMVQLPEACDETSEAFKAGYKTIAEISKERIRRAGKKIKEEAGLNGDGLDIGFRVLKVDSSNMKDVYYTPDAVDQPSLLGDVDNTKEGRTGEDLLFQVLMDWGVDLTLPITAEPISGKTVYFVDNNALAACFEPGIDEVFIKELANRKPLRAVFLDTGYGSDATKINVEQIFKLISPTTEVKSI